MRYYEIDFDDGYGICIKSEIEDPTEKQVGDFLVACGDKYNEDNIVMILETTLEEASRFYDMENEANFPILK